MKFLTKVLFFVFLFCTFNSLIAAPEIFLFLGGGSAKENWKYLNNSEIEGAQIIYSWKRLEPKKDVYNIEPILKDLYFLSRHGKKLFIQIQDRSFSIDNIPVPNYLLTDEYDGGVAKQEDFPGEGEPVGYGWVAKQWNDNVQSRFEKLLVYLGKELDGKITGINLPETSIDVNGINDKNIINCDKYFYSVIKNISVLKSSFKKSYVVQYVNFFPGEWNNDQKYMSRLFEYAVKNKIGLGNPDTVPYRKGQMKNSYPFFNGYKNRLSLISIAIQEPDYTYTNPKTSKKFTVKELYDFASDYIGADIIFWNRQEPEFTDNLVPFLKESIKRDR